MNSNISVVVLDNSVIPFSINLFLFLLQSYLNDAIRLVQMNLLRSFPGQQTPASRYTESMCFSSCASKAGKQQDVLFVESASLGTQNHISQRWCMLCYVYCSQPGVSSCYGYSLFEQNGAAHLTLTLELKTRLTIKGNFIWLW